MLLALLEWDLKIQRKKGMKKTKIFTIGALSTQMLLISAAHAAGNGIYFNSGKAILGYCDKAHPNADFAVMGPNGLILKTKSNSMGCISEVLDNVNYCEQIILGFNHGEYKIQVPGPVAGQSCPPSGNSAPQRDLADIEKVKMTAGNRAKQFANTVAAQFDQGKSNYIFNFILGYQFALESKNSDSVYKEKFLGGKALGGKSGLADGYSVGVSAGSSAAQTKAKNDVYAQYYKNLDSGKDIAAAPDLTVPSYSGASKSVDALSLNELISSQETRQQLINLFSEAGYSLSQSQLNAVVNRSMSIRDILLDLDSAWAYENHLKDQQNHQYVETLKTKENANEALAAYQSKFKDIYWSVVDEKIAKKIAQPQPKAQVRGQLMGFGLVGKSAESQGYASGYSSSYTAGSITGFTVSYPNSYKETFNSHVKRLNSSMEISEAKASITDAQGGTQFVIGQPVKLVISEAINLGRVSGAVDVALSGAIKASGAVHLKGQSRNQGLVIENIGFISPASSLGVQKISITVGGITISQDIEIKWQNQLKALATVQEPKALELLSSFVAGTLLQEWKTILNNKTVVQQQILYRDLKAYPKSMMGQFEALAVSLKKQNPDVVNAICEGMLKIFSSMLSPASVDNYAAIWLPKGSDVEAFKKLYTDARAEVAGDALLSKFANGCITDSKVLGTCVGAINIKSTDDYNKWTTGKAKVQAILKK